ncbi:MAG: cytochrome bc complex cytochrome b subunit, partial [Acidithiobacillus ferrooxidans]
PANPLKSLPDVTPPWYLSPFYAMLRSIPNKTAGILLMVFAVLVPFVLPWLDRNPVKSTRYRPVTRILLIIFFINFFVLAYLGEQPPLPKYFFAERLGAFIYVAFFLLLPFVSKFEPTRTPPARVRFHAH